MTHQSQPKLFKCDLCQKECIRKRTLENHLVFFRIAKKRLQCDLCKFTTLQAQTSQESSFEAFCVSKLRREVWLSNQVRKAHRKESWQVEVLQSKPFYFIFILEISTDFNCIECNKTFDTKNAFVLHGKWHRFKKMTECPDCRKLVKLKLLKKHQSSPACRITQNEFSMYTIERK